MTIEGNGIRCDVDACATESAFEAPFVLDPEMVRVRYAILGWTPGGEAGELDRCPRHL